MVVAGWKWWQIVGNGMEKKYVLYDCLPKASHFWVRRKKSIFFIGLSQISVEFDWFGNCTIGLEITQPGTARSVLDSSNQLTHCGTDSTRVFSTNRISEWMRLPGIPVPGAREALIKSKLWLQHWIFLGDYSSKYWSSPMLLNFSDQTRTGALNIFLNCKCANEFLKNALIWRKMLEWWNM